MAPVAVDQPLLTSTWRLLLIVEQQCTYRAAAENSVDHRHSGQLPIEDALVLRRVWIRKPCRIALQPHRVARIVIQGGERSQRLLQRDDLAAGPYGDLGAIVVLEAQVRYLLAEPLLRLSAVLRSRAYSAVRTRLRFSGSSRLAPVMS